MSVCIYYSIFSYNMRHKGIEWCTYQFAWAEFNSTDPFFNLFFRRQPCNQNGLIWAHWKRLTTAASFWRFEYLINWKQLALFQTDYIPIHFQTSNTFHFFTPEQSTKEKKNFTSNPFTPSGLPPTELYNPLFAESVMNA